MASQKDIAKKINSLEKQISTHEEKIRRNPDDRCVSHWRKEIDEFKKQAKKLQQELNTLSAERHCYNCGTTRLFNGNKCTKCGIREV